MLRGVSLLLAVLGALGPPDWSAIKSRAVVDEVKSAMGWVCGTPFIGIVTETAFASALLSLLAVTTGVTAHRRLALPRSRAWLLTRRST